MEKNTYTTLLGRLLIFDIFPSNPSYTATALLRPTRLLISEKSGPLLNAPTRLFGRLE